MRIGASVVASCLLIVMEAGAFLCPRAPCPPSSTRLQSTLRGGWRATRTQKAVPMELPNLKLDADLMSCSSMMLDKPPPIEPPDFNSALDMHVNLGEYGCTLWRLSDALRKGGSGLDRRSFVLGLKACVRMGESAAADEVHRLMNLHHGPGVNWRVWDPKRERAVTSAEEMATMAELYALEGDHAQVFDIYASLQDVNGNLPVDSGVYISLIRAFRTVGADDFASSLIDELCGLPQDSEAGYLCCARP